MFQGLNSSHGSSYGQFPIAKSVYTLARFLRVCLPIVEAALPLLRVGEVASLSGTQWHDLTLLPRRRREKMARSGTVWQAKSVAPWRSGVINWHRMARGTQRSSHPEAQTPEAHPFLICP